MDPDAAADLKRALRPVPTYERAVREVSRMLSDAGIRHALVGALGANAYRSRPRTTESIEFLATISDGVPIAPVETIVLMKLLAGRTQDLADVEAVVGSSADKHLLGQMVQRAAPGRLEMLHRVFDNVGRTR